MSILPAALFDFDFFEPLPIQIEVSDAPLTSDAGLLPLRQFDEHIGLTKQFAAVLDDPLTRHGQASSHRKADVPRPAAFSGSNDFRDPSGGTPRSARRQGRQDHGDEWDTAVRPAAPRTPGGTRWTARCRPGPPPRRRPAATAGRPGRADPRRSCRHSPGSGRGAARRRSR
jgi:hypothetical protein